MCFEIKIIRNVLRNDKIQWWKRCYFAKNDSMGLMSIVLNERGLKHDHVLKKRLSNFGQFRKSTFYIHKLLI